MKIDEALNHLYTYSSTLGSGQTTQAQHEEAKKVAIATMRKYQKIKPSYRSVPTFRNDEDYHDAEQYTKGWNDAMDYIFPESKKARDREAVRKNLKLLDAESDTEVRKPCINYEDGCEEWAGCPCVHYKGRN